MTEAAQQVIQAGVAFLFGLAFGSFANVVIHRLPRKPELAGTLAKPSGSYCPSCKAPIRARDNIPMVSYLILRGRCRSCGAPIAARYPLVELASGLLMAAAILRFGQTPRGAVAAWFFWVLLVLAVIDGGGVPKGEYANPFPEEEDELPDVVHVLPDKLMIPSLIAALAFAAIGQALGRVPQAAALAGSWLPLTPHTWGGLLGEPLVSALMGLLCGGGFLLVLALAHPGGTGVGDIKLAALMGVALGPWVLLAIFIGATTGVLASVVLIASGRRGARDPVPYGPFLAFGGVLTALAGPAIVAGYLGLFGMA